MPARRSAATARTEKQLKKEDRARRVVAKALADERFMSGVRESLDARRRGQRGARFDDVKRKDA